MKIRTNTAAAVRAGCIAIVALVAGPAFCADELAERRVPDTWAAFSLPWKHTPDSRADLSFLLHKPAGKLGHVVPGKDGHFRFAKGGRARFWGVTIHCAGSVAPTKAESDELAKRLAQLGCNLVRFHMMDTPAQDYSKHSGMITSDGKGGVAFDAERIDRFDYFIAQLRKSGIYYMMAPVNAGARRFGPDDNIPALDQLKKQFKSHVPKNALGYLRGVFRDHFKDFATKFLTHKNPYTGLTYAEDPALACLQMSNENVLFNKLLHKYPKPYTDAFNALWDQWLLKRYGSVDKLRAAWTDARGRSCLPAGQDPTKGTMDLWTARPNTPAWSDRRRFAADMEMDFYSDLVKHMRALGVKAPITGTNLALTMAHVQATARTTDHVAAHNYWDLYSYEAFHNIPMILTPPRYNKPLKTGAKYRSAGRSGAVPMVACAKVSGRGVVISEWATPWPHEYRSGDVLEVAAYAGLQDLDAMVYYCYQSADTQGWSSGHIVGETWGFPDPAAMGPFQMGALMFLRGDVKTAKRLVRIGTSDADTFYCEKYGWGLPLFERMIWPGSHLAYVSRIETKFFDKAYPREAEADLVISSGRTSGGDYSDVGRPVILGAGKSATDGMNVKRDWRGLFAGMYPSLKPAKPAKMTLDLSPWGVKKTITARIAAPLPKDALPPGATPVGLDADGKLCLGFVEGKRAVCPAMYDADAVDQDVSPLLTSHLMRRWGLLTEDTGVVAPGVVVSDTGQIRRDSNQGVLAINTPGTVVLSGLWGGAKRAAGPVEIECANEYAAFAVSSMEDKPIKEAGRLLMLVVAKVGNTGQIWATKREALPPRAAFARYGYDRHWYVRKTGAAPVRTEPVEATVTLDLPGRDVPKVHSLTPGGARKGLVRGVKRNGGKVVIPISPKDETVYYEIDRG